MEREYYSLGLLLTFIGVLILLLNMKLLSFSMLIFLLSLGLIAIYLIRKHRVYMISGVSLFVLSTISLINKHIFPNIDVRSFLFLLVLGIVLFILYERQNNKLFLVTALILASLAIYSLVRELTFGNISWLLVFLFAASFYIAYIIDYSRSGIEWPRYVALILLVVSLILLLFFGTSIKFGFWKSISYIIALILIGIGGRIIYNIIRLKG